jgi:hypothetical protein
MGVKEGGRRRGEKGVGQEGERGRREVGQGKR